MLYDGASKTVAGCNSDLKHPEFIGLILGPARGLTDTGAQQLVVGSSAALRWCDRLLKRHGLVPVDVTPSNMIATCGGIGTAKVVQVLDFPVGIVGVNAKTVTKEFKIAWVKHCGWPEIIVHDQGPEFMGHEFQNPAGAAGVLTMPIDSQSPWQNGKTERAGQSFKHQLWDLDEECHIEGETEFEAAVAECCDARNRYCNRSGFSAHQRVFGSSLRLPGSLLSDDPIDRQLLTADPYTDFSPSK